MIKKQITSKFDKSLFKLQSCDENGINDWDGVDEYIRDFTKKLNDNKHISTIYSCEGHKLGDYAYFYFNVDETGWDIYWSKVLPELSYYFCHPVKILGYIPEDSNVNPYYQLMWHTNVTDNEHNTGITIYCHLTDYENEEYKVLVGWEEKKKRFWSIMEETFLKNYK